MKCRPAFNKIVTMILASCTTWLECGAAWAAPPLRIVADASTAMPMALIQDTKLVGGIHRDVGMALARVLNTKAVFVVMPRKRIPLALEQCKADIACNFLPEWLDGKFDWSERFLPNSLVLLAHAQVARPGSVEALRGVPVGTVHGFAYPDVVRALGLDFVRDDAADATRNLMKFDAGRSKYVLTSEVFLRYQQRNQGLALAVHEPLVLRRYLAACAVSRTSRYPVEQIDRAIRRLRERDEVDAIYESYR